MLPSFGSVVGIDVGYSQSRRSSAVCRLDWDTTTVRWRIGRSKAIEHERAGIIAEIVGKEMLLAASFDGPLRRGLDVIGQYRAAERMLTRRLAPLIGKPGQANAPVGRQLNTHANACARVLLKSSNLLRSTHKIAIDDLAISEAFPSSFLGLMIKDPASLEAGRGDRSDTFFNYVATNGFLNRLLDHFLPGRRLESSFIEVKNHDDPTPKSAETHCTSNVHNSCRGPATKLQGSRNVGLGPRRFRAQPRRCAINPFRDMLLGGKFQR